jgi:diaminohydroxyphosphoribosylaminopyrimidine deaminase/5-amino-6-(5-phosphoribosylamino)uracil reductase
VNRDAHWMGAALTLAARAVGRTAPNPPVGCIILQGDRVVGRGWTQPGGRPHAEAMALAQAGNRAREATAYVTLEPCAHISKRGPTCADLLTVSGVSRVVIALGDPDPRTNGAGIARLEATGIETRTGVASAEARQVMAGFLMRQQAGRPHVTLKLATSLDGKIATAAGQSRWITGEEARAHAHLERARCDLILVGRGTLEADDPKLDVRLMGLENRSPRRAVLTRGNAPAGWITLKSPEEIARLDGVDHVLVEGGAGAAAAFLQADLIDRLLLYRAPVLIGAGREAIGELGLGDLAEAHGRWRAMESRQLGSDRLDVYERIRG